MQYLKLKHIYPVKKSNYTIIYYYHTLSFFLSFF